MFRFPRPWSKKRGKRFVGTQLRSILWEVAFYSGVFMLGVFVLSLVLLNRFSPETTQDLSVDALEDNSLSVWVFSILALAAMGSGAGGMLYRLMSVGASSERRSAMANRAGSIELIVPSSDDIARLPSVPRGAALTDSPGERLTYRLASENSQAGELMGPAILALLWNTVWFILLAVVVLGFWYGSPRYILAGLLVPFGTIGYWSFRYFLSHLRRFAGIGPTIVEISDHPFYAGHKYRVHVSQAGRLKFRSLSVRFVCEEETIFAQGTDVRVERHEVFTQELCDEKNVRVDPEVPWEQQFTLDLPRNAMHSFVGAHNAIRWKIIVTGEARPWPSFCRNFLVVVHPPGLPLRRSPR
ncbi:hypothetical protein [Stieleria varia]|uniref:Uncharacterized protein n=1 Tax=Stieleria varia TaxID=2528005 RepID=A0A5C5ZW33_9BACT|nr:hypothetical protein [Stieleria varia]TWT91315.1 hypothetical protein Pla52n_66490 [Stieleria varia]